MKFWQFLALALLIFGGAYVVSIALGTWIVKQFRKKQPSDGR